MEHLKDQLSAYSPDELVAFASALAGVAVFALARQFLSGLAVPERLTATGEGFEDRRRSLLRQGSGSYRMLEPLVGLMAARAGGGAAQRDRLERQLQAAGERLPWRPAELIGLRQAEGALIGVGLVILFGLMGSLPAGLLLGALAAFVYPPLALSEVGRRARRRLALIKRRLPFAIDLMAVMMEAGAGFSEALESAVRESAGNPLAEELGRVLSDTERGASRREALVAVQARLSDRDISELIFAIVKGEEMGTPLAAILRSAADQMRLLKSQTAEKEAGQAQVTILFPGMLVMLACILIIVAPFLLQAMQQRGGLGEL
jgi:tight adherence protein C